MKFRTLVSLALLLLAAQDSPPIAILSPLAGDVLRGKVTITGTTNVPDFAFSQLDFAYASDPADTWFAIQSSTDPVLDSPLAVWDTTAITDGDYVLRLRVNLTDGTFVEVTTLVKLQNDGPLLTPTSIPTPTPSRVLEQVPTHFLVAASPTPTATQHPTPTALPTNPASLNQMTIFTSLGRGALVILGLFVLSAIILRLRHY